MKDISEDIHQEVVSSLSQDVIFVPEEGGEEGDMQMQITMVEIEEKRFESIGPVIGQELRQKTILVAIVALLSMILYIAFSFRKVQRPLKSWQYGIISVIALFHDLLIPLAVFSILGRYYGIEFTIPVVTALLAVLGYSINNTVVVFDRIREHLLRAGDDFDKTVNASLNETLSRQINTSLTTLFVAGAIYFFGGATLQYFALALVLGILAGTYSSIFLAGPLLYSWNNIKEKRYN
jgi:preprotein translocase subunit SecF